MHLVYVSLAWLTGIFLGNCLNLPWQATGILLFLLPLYLLYRKKRKLLIISSLYLLALAGGIFRFSAATMPVNDHDIRHYHEETDIEIRGLIVIPPDIRDQHLQITLEASGIKIDGNWRAASGRILVFAPRYPEYKYGDFIQAEGNLSAPRMIEDFDYPGYLSEQQIYTIMYYPRLILLDSGHGTPMLHWIYDFRAHLSLKIGEMLPEPQAALAQGILLGLRGNIPSDVRNDFKITGTSHLLAISGLHLNIMAGLLIAAGISLMGKRYRLYIWLPLLLTWCYAVLTGFNPPVVRAAVIVSLFLSADLSGRQRNILPALALAAAVMTAITPRLLWDISFQLSFTAMLGLVYIVPRIQDSGRSVVQKYAGEEGFPAFIFKWLTDSLAVTLGVILAVWPLIAYYFGLFSLISPLATLLTLPVIPLIMISTTVAALAAMICPPIGFAISWFAWLFLSCLLMVVNNLASIPTAAIITGDFKLYYLFGYYILLTGIYLLSRKRRTVVAVGHHILPFLAGFPQKWILPPLAICGLLLTIFNFTLPDEKLYVSYLNVGQGDAILLQKGSLDVLIDGGPGPQQLHRELSARLPFWNRTIELVVLTHEHYDHLTGLIEVLKRYRVKQVLMPATASDSPLWREWLSLLDEKNIPVIRAQTGQKIVLGDEQTIIEVLNAPLPDRYRTPDDDSLVLHLLNGEVSFLFTSDITMTTEYDLLFTRATLRSTVLKVAHHGSASATAPGFLSVVKPVLAIISVGAENRYGHPAEEVLNRLGNHIAYEYIYRTDLDGTITLKTDGEKLWLIEPKREK